MSLLSLTMRCLQSGLTGLPPAGSLESQPVGRCAVVLRSYSSCEATLSLLLLLLRRLLLVLRLQRLQQLQHPLLLLGATLLLLLCDDRKQPPPCLLHNMGREGRGSCRRRLSCRVLLRLHTRHQRRQWQQLLLVGRGCV